MPAVCASADRDVLTRSRAVQEELAAVRAELGDSGRVLLRPSGTEPKIKCYIEIIEPVADRSLAAARAAAAARLAPLRDALEALLAAA